MRRLLLVVLRSLDRISTQKQEKLVNLTMQPKKVSQMGAVDHIPLTSSQSPGALHGSSKESQSF